MRNGRLLTFEGVDGCGKTTQARLLASRLRAAGYEVVETREPAGTSLGRNVGQVVLSTATVRIDAKAELLLFLAARAQHYTEVLEPAMAGGSVVVCDRFCDTTAAYQGAGRRLDPRIVDLLHGFATDSLMPDLTFFLDVSPYVSLSRCSSTDRIEGETLVFWNRVYDCFLSLASRQPDRIKRIDGTRCVQHIAQEVWGATMNLLIPGEQQVSPA